MILSLINCQAFNINRTVLMSVVSCTYNRVENFLMCLVLYCDRLFLKLMPCSPKSMNYTCLQKEYFLTFCLLGDWGQQRKVEIHYWTFINTKAKKYANNTLFSFKGNTVIHFRHFLTPTLSPHL